MSQPLPELFTIGHSNHPIEVFSDLLRCHRIEAVADVRSRPYSRFVPHFAKERLARLLQAQGIGYLYLGAALGGKPLRDAAPSPAPDYAARIAEPAFQAAIEELLTAARAQRITLLCRERDSLDCHRFHLICRAVRRRVGAIHHVLPGGAIEPQAATERRLLERVQVRQLGLFDHSDEAALAGAYDALWGAGRSKARNT